MQQVAIVLSALDEPTRLRVLQWAIQRFDTEMPAAHRASPLQAGRRLAGPDADAPADEGLSVSTLEDLFNPREPEAHAVPADETPRQGVSGMLSEFVAEFQDVVREWNAASETPADAGDQRASSAA